MIFEITREMDYSLEFQNTFGMRFIGLEDPAGSQYSTYRVPDPLAPYPQDYVIDANGVVRYWSREYDPRHVTQVIDQLVGAPYELEIVPDPLVGGQQGSFAVERGAPNLATYLIYSLAGPGSTYVPQLDVTLGLASPVLAAPPLDADQDGALTWIGTVPGTANTLPVWLQSAQDGRVSNVVETELVP